MKIFNSYHIKVKYFRPAYGIIDEYIIDILEKKNLKGVIWSIDSQDWNSYSGEKLVNNIIENLKGGDIILFHDNISLIDLKSVIDAIHRKGYEIVSIDRIMSFERDFPK